MTTHFQWAQGLGLGGGGGSDQRCVLAVSHQHLTDCVPALASSLHEACFPRLMSKAIISAHCLPTGAAGC